MRSPSRWLLLSSYTWQFAEGMLGPLFAIFSERVGGDILNITGAWAAYLIVGGILTLAIGAVSERLGKRRLLLIGYALNAIFTFAYLLVQNAQQLLFLQMGLGVAAALATPTWNALYALDQEPHRAGLMWGVESGISKILIGIAIMLGGLIVTHYSFTALFLLMGTLQFMATLLVLPLCGKKKEKIIF